MKGVSIDSESRVVEEKYALVYAPRRQRGRFPENNVNIVASRQEALERANPAEKIYPARVIGPSRSSEGLRLYYLDCWLD